MQFWGVINIMKHTQSVLQVRVVTSESRCPLTDRKGHIDDCTLSDYLAVS